VREIKEDKEDVIAMPIAKLLDSVRCHITGEPMPTTWAGMPASDVVGLLTSDHFLICPVEFMTDNMSIYHYHVIRLYLDNDLWGDISSGIDYIYNYQMNNMNDPFSKTLLIYFDGILRRDYRGLSRKLLARRLGNFIAIISSIIVATDNGVIREDGKVFNGKSYI